MYGKITRQELSDELIQYIKSSKLSFGKNTVCIEETSNTVNIGIPGYNKNTDLLMVYKNTIYLEENTLYTVSDDSLHISNPNGEWEADTLFNFIVIKCNNMAAIDYGDFNDIPNGSITEDKLDPKFIQKINSLILETTESSNNNLKIVDDIAERDGLENIKNGVLCYVKSDGVYYSRKNDEWELFEQGSGGGAVIGTLTSTLDQKTISISLGDPLIVDLFFSTPNVGSGTLHVLSNGTELLTQSISMGNNKVTIDLTKGTHKLELYVVDRGGVYTNSILINVKCGGLEISSSFNSEKDYNVGSAITYPYTINTISTEPIITHFIIGKNTYDVKSKNGYNTYTLPKLGAGKYTVEVYSTSGEFESNKLRFTLVILNSGSLYVSSLFEQKEAEEGDQLIIDYRVSMKDVKEFNVEYYVDDKLYKKGKAYNGSNTFPISDLKQGERKITIKVITTDDKHTASVDILINIIESSYQLQQPVDSGLIAWFDAYGLTNQDIDKGIWRDKNGSEYVGTLHNFNYHTNGWMNNGLKMNGSAYAKIDIQPFLNNVQNGITIDIEFETEDIGNENARVLDCVTTLSSNVGCYIDTSEASIKSNANTVKSPFTQNEKTRITYVVDRLNKLTKIYVNAVLCEVAFLTDMGTGNDEILEDFKHSEYIYLNSKKGESDFGDCTIYSVRIYERALDSEEVLQNHIADIRDKELQKKKYDFNHNNTIPTMYFIGDVSEMTKEHRVPLQIKYISTNDKLYGPSFDLENCEVQWQGTSSLQYAVKNYKIRLQGPDGKKFKRPLREGMIPESKFVLKADYMESSHANNTGLAKIVNRYLYDSKLPPQQTNKNIVSAIDGFPIKLYINEDLIGVFNFNLDKGCDDSFGLDLKKYPECVSYEISANTDTTAGAFNKWTGEPGGEAELEYLKKDFELRFPDDKKYPDHGYLDRLKRVVDWVSDADDEKFRTEFEDYFNKEYTFKYYLFVLAMGMVDNLGKNMMLNTWDGKIWFPCFYDLDTCLSLDNSGYIKFDVDIEMTAGVYNTSGSKLWSKVGRVFEKELAQMYINMRATIFKEENIFKVLLDEQIDQIPELLYNLDSEQKYIKYGKKYIHMLHGSRREHMRKWITERLLYLDSKLGYDKHTKESITVRANKQGWVKFNIKTYSPMYIKVRWRNGEEMVKKVDRNKTVEFGYELPTATDQEIFIYAAKHLKEIGDISHMTPTSLSLGDATRLTKLICRDNPKLQALGMGGVVDGVSYNLKNLQLLDLTNCSELGKTSGNNGLDVAYCDNLKILKIQGTSLQNVTFNLNGGNLEEIYMSNSVTSLYLTNQYNLKKVQFPDPYSWSYELLLRNCYDWHSKIINLTIDNCPNLVDFGFRKDISLKDNLVDYRGVNLNKLELEAPISYTDYHSAYRLSCLSRLEKIKINNSLLNIKYFNINCSPNLTTVKFENMPNIKGLIFTGNRHYAGTGGLSNNNFEKTPMFEGISINKCPEFDTLILQAPWVQGHHYGIAYKFKENFEWDLSNLPLKKFHCNMGLENLKKIILPESVEEFTHSCTDIRSKAGWNYSASDGSRGYFDYEMAPLETIVVKNHYNEEFKGIDFDNILLNNVNFNGLTKKVEIIKNINCIPIDINPRIISGHVSEQTLENININLNEYKGSSLYGTFKNTDMSKVQVTLEHSLTTEGMNYSEMFRSAKNVLWERIKWVKNLPKGKFEQAFADCDVDMLEVGHMIGPTTGTANSCFKNMPKVTAIDLTGADFSNVTDFRNMLSSCPKLASNIVVDRKGATSTMSMDYMFRDSPNIGQIELKGFETCRQWVGIFTGVPNVRVTGMPKITKNSSDWDKGWAAYNGVRGSIDFKYNPNVVITDGGETFSPHVTGVDANQRPFTVESLVNTIQHLENLTGQSSKTLKLGPTISQLTTEQIQQAKNKNWTLTQ